MAFFDGALPELALLRRGLRDRLDYRQGQLALAEIVAHVLAGGLGAHQQQVFAAQQRGDGLLPDVGAVVQKARPGDAVIQVGGHAVGIPEAGNLADQRFADAFLF